MNKDQNTDAVRNRTTWSIWLLLAGLLLIIIGLCELGYRANAIDIRFGYLLSFMVPGCALLIMSWVGCTTICILWFLEKKEDTHGR